MQQPTTDPGTPRLKNMSFSRNSQNRAIRSALVVLKKSGVTDARERSDLRTLKLLQEQHPAVTRMLLAHEENESTIAAVRAELLRRCIDSVYVFHEGIKDRLSSNSFDLILTIGGDGMVLDVSHCLKTETPILSVNSSPSTSHGHWCLASAANLGQVLDKIISGRLRPRRIMRLQALLKTDDSEQLIPELVLNEILVAHSEVGGTSSYILNIRGLYDEQKSDGLFIGPPGGCTGWMRSYGALPLPVECRQIQYLSRGLINPPGRTHSLSRGLLTHGTIRVVSKMDEGRIWIDGRHVNYAFPKGAELQVSKAPQDLWLFIDPRVNESYNQVF
jgi:NAD+ kinase